MDLAKEYGVSIKTYDIIYKVVEEMEAAMKGMLEPEFEESCSEFIEVNDKNKIYPSEALQFLK